MRREQPADKLNVDQVIALIRAALEDSSVQSVAVENIETTWNVHGYQDENSRLTIGKLTVARYAKETP